MPLLLPLLLLGAALGVGGYLTRRPAPPVEGLDWLEVTDLPEAGWPEARRLLEEVAQPLHQANGGPFPVALTGCDYSDTGAILAFWSEDGEAVRGWLEGRVAVDAIDIRPSETVGGPDLVLITSHGSRS